MAEMSRWLIGVPLVGTVAALYWFAEIRTTSSPQARQAFVGRYCLDCHNAADKAGELSLEDADLARLENDSALWEAVIRKLRLGMMPPSEAPHPPAEGRKSMIVSLEQSLDRTAADRPDPGAALVRRLNRAEYANAVRDLLSLEVDATVLLPPDDSAYGFDNIADALATSPVHVEQYLSAAGQIAALAVGDPDDGPVGQTFRIRQDASQDIPVVGMPVGTVGGGVANVVLPLDGEYRLDIRFFKSNLGALKGLELPHELEITIDGERVHLVTIGGPDDFAALMRNITEAADDVEARSSVRLRLTAGPHEITVGFVYAGAELTSVRLQPYLRSSQDVLDVTGHPHIETLTVTGPFDPTGPGSTPSRATIFVCHPDDAADNGSAEPSIETTDVASPETSDTASVDAPNIASNGTATPSVQHRCASEILSQLAHRGYRGLDTPSDVETLLAFYELGREQRGFEAGVQTAIERLLSSPQFLFRIEHDPEALPPGSVHALSDVELASRLSFFLWSSIPDQTLLTLAADDALSEPAVLAEQIRRMLADPKSRALVDNFAAQWLYLRNLDRFVPNSVGFPNFDDNLRQALRTETELFFESIIAEDRNVFDLLTADYTFLNERVARHYRIPGVYGGHFRRVTLEDETRFGLLGKGSVLMVSSHTDRTSPVVRGKWVLENLLGAPPPVPPPNVPALEDVDPEGVLSLRERMVAHRENAVCAACHATMDPIGFALENFDAVGAWRDNENGFGSQPIDASGSIMGGVEVDGPIELRRALAAEPELFVSTVVQKLMIYALGRGLGANDMPAVRKIVRDSAANEYRFSAIVQGIVASVPFRMRRKPGGDDGTLASRGENR